MLSICNMDCCDKCDRKEACGGCIETGGHPFQATCIAAKYIKSGGFESFLNLKNKLIDEINSLGIKNLHVDDLNLLSGSYVNLIYELSNGQSIKLLKDNNIYLGNQIELLESNRCLGVVGDDEYLLVCEYGTNGSNPTILLYKKRLFSLHD